MDALSGKCALAPALIMSKDIMIEDNSLKFVKPMKEEILKFRTICENMVKAGITNKNKITIESGISWPTFQKVMAWPIDTVHVEDEILARMVSFTRKHSVYAGREVDSVIVDDLKDNPVVDKEKMKEWLKPKLGRGKYIRKHEPKPKVEKHEIKPIAPDLKMDKEEIISEFTELKETKNPLDSLTGDELFWFHLGKAMSFKPDNITLTILTK
jgi:hypothetical protein